MIIDAVDEIPRVARDDSEVSLAPRDQLSSRDQIVIPSAARDLIPTKAVLHTDHPILDLFD